MARKKKHAEHVNHERWLVSYADFITLLFAFFVVMFAVSQVDSKKLGHFQDSVNSAFNTPLLMSTNGVNVMNSGGGGNAFVPPFVPNRIQFLPSFVSPADREILLERVEEKIADSKHADVIRVDRNEHDVFMTVASASLFGVGTSQLRLDAPGILATIAEAINVAPFSVDIDVDAEVRGSGGDTLAPDWELPAVRAAHIARLLCGQGVDPARLRAGGVAGLPVGDETASEAEERPRIVRITFTIP